MDYTEANVLEKKECYAYIHKIIDDSRRGTCIAKKYKLESNRYLTA